ncbi:hypothetical protein F5Y13DRAFT_184925 [Hypoxylon sp. FL1857]|nr:hypothetical protein F5Y13DRAFT_184925 [Hypoxylon sp. FL1857]
MGYPTQEKKSSPAWMIIHVLAVLGQLSLCIVGAVNFISTHPNGFDHIPDDDEFWDNADDNTTLPWVAAGLGGATTVVQIILTVVLWKSWGPNEQVRLMRPINGFKKVVIISSIVMKLIMSGDITLAIKGGKAGKTDICAAGAVGAFFLLVAIVSDVHRLRKLKKDKKKSNYIMELGYANETAPMAPMAPMAGPPVAPPPYSAAGYR